MKSRPTQPGHPGSNGKAERTQALIQREVVIPCLISGHYDSIPELQEALDGRMDGFNHERPHFGKINPSIPPWTVALECAGLNDADRKLKLTELRAGLRSKNRNAWMKARSAQAEADLRQYEALVVAEECDQGAYEAGLRADQERLWARARATQEPEPGESQGDAQS